MNISSFFSRSVQQRNAAFTMIEVAIALAVIGFALVAIIGVLPTGLTAQKQNKEETIINQDGPYFLEAIRSGGRGLDILTNNVDSIFVVYTNPLPPVTNQVYSIDGGSGYLQTTASNIIGALSHPTGPRFGNLEKVTARVRALSGSAIETGGALRDFAFAYELTVQVVPLSWETNLLEVTSITAPTIPKEQTTNFFNAMRENSFEIRVTCRWPLINGKPGPNVKTFRALSSGRIERIPGPPLDRFFFMPRYFKDPNS